MRFADIPGNEGLKRTLVSMADSGRVAHAMLLFENEGCGALPLSMAYLQYLNCQHRQDGDSCGECPSCRQIAKLIHPDTHYIFPVNTSKKVTVSKPTSESFMGLWRELVQENPYFLESGLFSHLGIEGKEGTIAIAEAKYIIDRLSLSAVEDGYKAVVVWMAERLRTETANKLLKIVEEPPQKTIFIFITHKPDRILQTIFSRCQSFRVLPQTEDEVLSALTGIFGKDQAEASVQARLCGGSLGVALDAMGDREEYKAFMEIFADLMEGVASKDLLQTIEASDRMSALDSRDKRKAFCIFAAEGLRKIYMLQQGSVDIAGVAGTEEDFYSYIAKKADKSFCPKALAVVDRSFMLLDRNVNQKMVFCDMAGRFFLNF